MTDTDQVRVKVRVNYLSPVTGNTAETTRHNLVKDTNHASLGKVLHPAALAVAGRGVGVLVVLVLPVTSAAEGRAVVGQSVPVQAVGDFMDHGVQTGVVLKDHIAVGEGEGSSSIVQTRSSDKVSK